MDKSWVFTSMLIENRSADDTEARKRIAQCAEQRSTTLDLSGLKLFILPAELFELTWLKSLNLSRNSLNDNAVLLLPALTHLITLELESNKFSDRGVYAISALSGLANLKLGGNRISGVGVRALTKLAGLKSLGISNNIIGPEGAHELARLITLTNLEAASNNLGVDGARAVSALENLISLDVSFNNIKGEGARALSSLAALTELKIKGNRLWVEGARALASLTRLTRLDLSNNNIGAKGAISLSNLAALNSLSLFNNDIGTKGTRAISELPNILHLNLGHNKIKIEGLRALTLLNQLTILNIAGGQLEDISPLLEFQFLEEIILSRNRVRMSQPLFWLRPCLRKAIIHDAALGNVPVQLLSQNDDDNCLLRLQAHFRDLGFRHGVKTSNITAVPVRDVKVIVLGNGRIGKTQTCRRLRGEPFIENDTSTHGIIVQSAEFPASKNGDPSTPLHFWDFGGQDIYLGTHALFLRTQAIFAIVWTPKSEDGEHEWSGVRSSNFPLSYWVRYVKQMAGTNYPLIISQSLWPGDTESKPPVEQELLHQFTQHEAIAYSPQTDRHREVFERALRIAISKVHRNGIPTIGGGRAWVKSKLEDQCRASILVRKSGLPNPAAAIITRQDFDALCSHRDCVAAGGVVDSGELLRFLHDIGTVFAFSGIVDNKIIIDLEWALQPIYAVFERERGVYQHIAKVRGGRFTMPELSQFLWTKLGHGVDEQKIFLEMMLACRIAFRLRGFGGSDTESEYVAPDLLPSRDQIKNRLDQVWDARSPGKPQSIHYELLPPGLMRSLMTEIGADGGISAIYWKDGFYFYDAATRTKAIVSQNRAEGWSGRIDILTQGQEKEALKRTISGLVKEHQDRFGIVGDGLINRYRSDYTEWIDKLSVPAGNAKELGLMGGPTSEEDDGSASQFSRNDASRTIARPRPGPTPILSQAYYMSYAWGSATTDASSDDRKREAVADAICRGFEAKGIAVRRDRDVMRFGDLIGDFMEQIAASQNIILILSGKYLRSPFCMYELFRIYEKCRVDRNWSQELTRRVQVWRLPCADISGSARFEHSDFWSAQVQKYEKRLAQSPGSLGVFGYREYLLAREYAAKVSDILFVLGDQLGPEIRDVEDSEAILAAILSRPQTPS